MIFVSLYWTIVLGSRSPAPPSNRNLTYRKFLFLLWLLFSFLSTVFFPLWNDASWNCCLLGHLQPPSIFHCFCQCVWFRLRLTHAPCSNHCFSLILLFHMLSCLFINESKWPIFTSLSIAGHIFIILYICHLLKITNFSQK